jgi:hypothetical protein
MSVATGCQIGDTSDGYHTFNELYEHRHSLFIALANSYLSISWKSKFHDDGTMWDGWFIAGMRLPTGDITYHLPIKCWDLLRCKEIEKAYPWDGHTSHDVVNRLNKWIF